MKSLSGTHIAPTELAGLVAWLSYKHDTPNGVQDIDFQYFHISPVYFSVSPVTLWLFPFLVLQYRRTYRRKISSSMYLQVSMKLSPRISLSKVFLSISSSSCQILLVHRTLASKKLFISNLVGEESDVI